MAISDIRFKRLGYVALSVTDLGRSRHFYEDLVGLTGDDETSGSVAFLRCSGKHHDLALYQAAKPGLKRLGWEMESTSALRSVREHLNSLGIATVAISNGEAAELGLGEAFRATEPTTGATFEFYADMDDAARPFTVTHTKIARLGHVVINSTDREKTERFLLNELNFRASDRIEGMVTFLRCFPNPYHHSLGVGRAEMPGFHHINFMTTELDDIGKGLNRMKRNNVPIVFGPGKHPPSESVFLYFLDPDGMTVEYSYGMEEFPEDEPREPRAMPASMESVDYWDGRPEPGMAKIGEIERID